MNDASVVIGAGFYSRDPAHRPLSSSGVRTGRSLTKTQEPSRTGFTTTGRKGGGRGWECVHFNQICGL